MTADRWVAVESNWPTRGRPRVANQAARPRWGSSSTLTPQRAGVEHASWKRESSSTQTSTRAGSSDTEVKELAVIAWSKPSCTQVTTATPVAKRAITARNSLDRHEAALELRVRHAG